MDWKSTRLPYQQTGYFSRIITDYLDHTPALAPFYAHPASPEGYKAALEARKKSSPVDRTVLVTELKQQYAGLPDAPAVTRNIDSLGQQQTFTVCTAHQPAIFTGHLYFIYKILHTIRLAEYLNEQHKDSHFVPVFYMGSEDADLEELGKKRDRHPGRRRVGGGPDSARSNARAVVRPPPSQDGTGAEVLLLRVGQWPGADRRRADPKDRRYRFQIGFRRLAGPAS